MTLAEFVIKFALLNNTRGVRHSLLRRMDIWESWFYHSRCPPEVRTLVRAIDCLEKATGLVSPFRYHDVMYKWHQVANWICKMLVIRCCNRKQPTHRACTKQPGNRSDKRAARHVPTGRVDLSAERARGPTTFVQRGYIILKKIGETFSESYDRHLANQRLDRYKRSLVWHHPITDDPNKTCKKCLEPQFRLENEAEFHLPIDETKRFSVLEGLSEYERIHALGRSGFYTGVELKEMIPSVSVHQQLYADGAWLRAHPWYCSCYFGGDGVYR